MGYSNPVSLVCRNGGHAVNTFSAYIVHKRKWETIMNMTLLLLVAGLAIMVYNLFSGVQLRREVQGGIIGLRLGQLLVMILMFAVGYLAAAILALGQPENGSLLVLAVILLLGAAFVTLVLRLIRDVIAALG